MSVTLQSTEAVEQIPRPVAIGVGGEEVERLRASTHWPVRQSLKFIWVKV